MNRTQSKGSYKDIKVTLHAKQRAYERLGLNSEKEIRMIAQSSRVHGIKLNTLYQMEEVIGEKFLDSALSSDSNFASRPNLSLNSRPEEITLQTLKDNFKIGTNSQALYYYKGAVFIFAGKNSKTLISIVVPDRAL